MDQMVSDKLVLSYRMLQLGEKGSTVIAQQLSTPFIAKKIMSPGVNQDMHLTLDSFLNSAANDCCAELPEGVHPNQIHAKELRHLADLLEKGDRILEIFSMSDKGNQIIVMKVKDPIDA